MIRKDKAFIITAVLEILAIIFVSLGIWIAYTNNNIEVSYFDVKDDLIPYGFDGFKIAHVSDLHNKDWKGKLEKEIASYDPDIIVVTGDIVDSSDKYYDKSVSFLKEAVKIAPVYFVTGNHEAYMEDYEPLEKALLETGVNIIDDKSVIIEKDGSSINMAGIKDPSFTERNDSLYRLDTLVTDKINRVLKDGYYNIVLSHRPEYFDAYAQTKANLVLSGHAHGGQVIIPSVGGLIAPGQGFFPKYTQGLHVKNYTSMIVSRGLGDSYLPRVNNMPELVMITLKCA